MERGALALFPIRNYEGRIALVIEIDKTRYLKLTGRHAAWGTGERGQDDPRSGRQEAAIRIVRIR